MPTDVTLATLLRSPDDLAVRATDDHGARRLALVSIAAILGGGACFGAAVGSHRGSLQILYAAVKLPLVLFVTLAVAVPAFHTLAAALGRPTTFRSMASLALAASGRMALVLFALAAPLALLLELGLSYHRSVVLASVGFGLAGLAAMRVVARALSPGKGRLMTLAAFVLVYFAAGSQVAWVSHPYFVRPRGENRPDSIARRGRDLVREDEHSLGDGDLRLDGEPMSHSLVILLYAGVGVIVAILVFRAAPERGLVRVAHAAVALPLWPLFGPIALFARESRAVTAASSHASARVEAALREGVEAARGTSLERLLSHSAAERIRAEVARAAEREAELSRLLERPDFDLGRRPAAWRSSRAIPRARVPSRPRASTSRTSSRLVALRDRDARTLEELADLARRSAPSSCSRGSPAPGRGALISSSEVWARVEGLGRRPSGRARRDRGDEPTHILVVDDEARIREVVQYALEREGFDVTSVDDGRAPLAAIARRRRRPRRARRDAPRARRARGVPRDPRDQRARADPLPLGARRGDRSRPRPRARRRRLPRPSPSRRASSSRACAPCSVASRAPADAARGPARACSRTARSRVDVERHEVRCRRHADRPHAAPSSALLARAARAPRRRALARAADAARVRVRQPRHRAHDRHPRAPHPREVPRRTASIRSRRCTASATRPAAGGPGGEPARPRICALFEASPGSIARSCVVNLLVLLVPLGRARVRAHPRAAAPRSRSSATCGTRRRSSRELVEDASRAASRSRRARGHAQLLVDAARTTRTRVRVLDATARCVVDSHARRARPRAPSPRRRTLVPSDASTRLGDRARSRSSRRVTVHRSLARGRASAPRCARRSRDGPRAYTRVRERAPRRCSSSSPSPSATAAASPARST